MRRSSVAVLTAGLLLAGCTGEAPVTGTGASSASSARTVNASPSASGCPDTPLWIGAAPEWTASAQVPGQTPYVLSHEGNLVGLLFGGTLRAGPNVSDPTNKILWVSREPRGNGPLRLSLQRADGTGEPVTQTEPADSGPGEIYPSIVDAPAPGCWRVQASWNGQTATLELNYRPLLPEEAGSPGHRNGSS